MRNPRRSARWAKTSRTFSSFFGTKPMALPPSPARCSVWSFFLAQYLNEETLFLSYGIVLQQETERQAANIVPGDGDAHPCVQFVAQVPEGGHVFPAQADRRVEPVLLLERGQEPPPERRRQHQPLEELPRFVAPARAHCRLRWLARWRRDVRTSRRLDVGMRSRRRFRRAGRRFGVLMRGGFTGSGLLAEEDLGTLALDGGASAHFSSSFASAR